jgi:hypothetical protein
MPQLEFEAASLAYADSLQALLELFADVQGEFGAAIPPNMLALLNINALAVGGPAIKTNYVTQLGASLAEINALQQAHVAHYNPVYLAGAAALLAQVQAGAFDLPAGAAVGLPQVVQYGNLYNDGTFNWDNAARGAFILPIFQQYAHSFVAAGGTLPITLTVSYYAGTQPQTVQLTLPSSATVADLKHAFLTAIQYQPTPDDQIAAWGPDGSGLAPDTAQLGRLGVKSSDTVEIDYPGAAAAFG